MAAPPAAAGAALGWARRAHAQLGQHARRLSAHHARAFCAGEATVTSLQATLRNVLINFSLLDERAAAHLWASPPLVGRPRPGALKMACSNDDLAQLTHAFSGMHLQPLMAAVRSRRRLTSRTLLQSSAVAVLVLSDYPNFFHQMGSVVITCVPSQHSMAPPSCGLRLDAAASSPRHAHGRCGAR